MTFDSQLQNVLRGLDLKNYSLSPVSWNDNVRFKDSCWGANITDSRLKGKDGSTYLVLRSKNFNERLGHVSADSIALVAGNTNKQDTLKPITLKTLLNAFPEYAGYAFTDVESLYDETMDKNVSIRFQATFLPLNNTNAVEFLTETYNYNTFDDSNPRNAVVVATTQGLAVSTDSISYTQMYHHNVTAGTKHYLEAEEDKAFSVGGQQSETKDQRDEALSRGKATSSVIGIKAMGTRFNALLTVQIPLKQREVHRREFAKPEAVAVCYGGNDLHPLSSSMEEEEEEFDPFDNTLTLASRSSINSKSVTSHAARVSIGSEAGKLHKKFMEIKRDSSQPITVTVMFYYTTKNGIPTKEDVQKAISDMELLYKNCQTDGHLFDDNNTHPTVDATPAVVGGQIKMVSNKVPLQVKDHDQFPV